MLRTHLVLYATQERLDAMITGYVIQYGKATLLSEATRYDISVETSLSSSTVPPDCHVLYRLTPAYRAGDFIDEDINRIIGLAKDFNVSIEHITLQTDTGLVTKESHTGNAARFLRLTPEFVPGEDSKKVQNNHHFF